MSANNARQHRHLHSVTDPETPNHQPDTRPVIVIDSNTAKRQRHNGPTHLSVPELVQKPWYKKHEKILLVGTAAALAGVLVVQSVFNSDYEKPRKTARIDEIPTVTYIASDGDNLDGIADMFTATPAAQNQLRDAMEARRGGPELDPGDIVVVKPGAQAPSQ